MGSVDLYSNQIRMVFVHMIDLLPSSVDRFPFHSGDKLCENRNESFELELHDDVPELSFDALG
jgi:hypothetical protein